MPLGHVTCPSYVCAPLSPNTHTFYPSISDHSGREKANAGSSWLWNVPLLWPGLHQNVMVLPGRNFRNKALALLSFITPLLQPLLSLSFKIFTFLPKKTPHLIGNYFPSAVLLNLKKQLVSFLSVQIYQFFVFHINGMIYCMAFMPGFFYLAHFWNLSVLMSILYHSLQINDILFHVCTICYWTLSLVCTFDCCMWLSQTLSSLSAWVSV